MAKRKSIVHPKDVEKRPDESLGREFPLFNTDLFDAAVGMGLVSIRQSWPPSLTERLAAAVVSNNLGIGMDYALKTYVRDAGHQQQTKIRLDERIERAFNQAVDSANAAYAFPKPRSAPEQDFFFALSFLKATSSLQVAHRLAQQGYLSEAITVSRLALETLAWGSTISAMPDGAEYLDVSTRRAISAATKTWPNFGKLYGVASKFAHWETEIHLSFLSKMEGLSAVLSRSVVHKIGSLLFLLGCADLALSVFVSHMARFYPDYAISDCKASKPGLAALARELLEVTKGRTSRDDLLTMLASCWLSDEPSSSGTSGPASN